MRKRHIMTLRVKLRALTVYQVLTQMMFPWNLGLCVRRGRNILNLVRLDAAMQKGTYNTIQGRDSCMSCAAGTFTEHGGAMSSAPCVAGIFSGNGSSVQTSQVPGARRGQKKIERLAPCRKVWTTGHASRGRTSTLVSASRVHIIRTRNRSPTIHTVIHAMIGSHTLPVLN